MFLKRHTFFLLIVFLTGSALSQSQIVRPLPPTSMTLPTPPYTNQIVVTVNPANNNALFTVLRHDVLLVSDFITPLDQAFNLGKGKNSGHCISGTITGSENRISLPVKTAGKYFLAARTSGISGGHRVNSGWKIHSDANGVPIALSIGNERLSAQAYYISRNGQNSSNAIGVFDFNMNITGRDFTITRKRGSQNADTLLSFPFSGSAPNNAAVYGRFTDFVNDFNTNVRYAIVRDNNNADRFTIFALFDNLTSNDTLAYTVKSGANILYEGGIAAASNPGLENMITTAGRLTAVPAGNAFDPVQSSVPANRSDSLSSQFLFAAIAHKALAHNSPRGNSNEESAGIFSNYIQFYDDIVRNWSLTPISNSAAGLGRIKAFYSRICTQNMGTIADSVWALNHGTISEYGTNPQLRKNYAFYDGYTRLMVDLEQPLYGTQNSGAGIMFRISGNINLYQADIANGANTFGVPFLNGNTQRRVIYSAKNPILNKLDSAGLWVRGSGSSNVQQSYYTGVQAVRLPLIITAPVSIGNPFSIPGNIPGGEKQGRGDPRGTLVGGPEKSVVHIKTVRTGGNDTLQNCEYPYILLRGHEKVFIPNSSFINDSSTLEARSNNSNFSLTNANGNIILTRASTLAQNDSSESVVINFLEFHNTAGNPPKLSRAFSKTFYYGGLIFGEDYINGGISHTSGTIYPIAIEKSEKMRISRLFNGNGHFKIAMDKGMRIHTLRNAGRGNQLLPPVNGGINLSSQELRDGYIVDCQTFYTAIGNSDSLFIVLSDERNYFSIEYLPPGNNSGGTANDLSRINKSKAPNHREMSRIYRVRED